MPISDKKVIFKIPVYKEPPDTFYKYLEANRDESISNLIDSTSGVISEHYQKYYSSPENLPHPNLKKISWKYNRIVGWIELYLDGKTIKAELWEIRLQRIPKDFNPNYYDRSGKITDVCSTHYLNSEEIKGQITRFFKDLQNDKYGYKWLKKCYIYTKIFFKQLKYIDIKRMVEEESK